MRGVAVADEDRLRGAIIKAILCQGRAALPAAWADAARPALTDVAQRGLIRWDGDELVLEEGSQPYARTIAARFDRFRGTIAPADTAAIAR